MTRRLPAACSTLEAAGAKLEALRSLALQMAENWDLVEERLDLDAPEPTRFDLDGVLARFDEVLARRDEVHRRVGQADRLLRPAGRQPGGARGRARRDRCHQPRHDDGREGSHRDRHQAPRRASPELAHRRRRRAHRSPLPVRGVRRGSRGGDRGSARPPRRPARPVRARRGGGTPRGRPARVPRLARAGPEAAA